MSSSSSPQEMPPEPTSKRNEELVSISWNLELLISGITLLTLFRVPEGIDEKITEVLLLDQKSWIVVLLLMLRGLTVISMFNLLLHLGSRGLWVGLITLKYAYPSASNWKSLNLSDLFNRYVEKRVANYDVFIQQIDRFCSMLFSLTYLIIITAGFGALFGALFTGIGAQYPILPILLGSVFLVLSVIIAGLNWILKKEKYAAWNNNPRLEKIVFQLNDIYHTISLIKVFRPYMNTFTAALSSVRLILIITGYSLFLGIYPLFYLGIIKYSGTIYFPSASSDVGASSLYYEDSAVSEPTSFYPSIPSDIITHDVVRVFIPYRTLDNDTIAKLYPDLKEFHNNGWFFGDYRQTDSINRRTAIAAIQSLYEISVNDSRCEGVTFFSQLRGRYAQRGYIAYIPIGHLPNGLHHLSIYRKTNSRLYRIPFWKETRP